MTGTVISVDEREVVIISDLNLDHIKVRLHNVCLDVQVSTGVDQLSQFQFHDLVTLDNDTVGVIIRLEREYVEVLNAQGNVVRAKAMSIQTPQVKFAKAFDSLGNTIQANDRVKVSDKFTRALRNDYDERCGEIKYIFQSSVFVYSRKYIKNSGIFVCKSKMVTLLGANNAPAVTETTNTSFFDGLKRLGHLLSGYKAASLVHSSVFSQNGRSGGFGGVSLGAPRRYLGMTKDVTELLCTLNSMVDQISLMSIDLILMNIVDGHQTT
ncbi:hypothetical protein M3Y96_01054400 [Aphelenchoides besseyi]|nr:hypothetical protein M3Y96_01054400 [Aphelenchoides besseyi]